MTIDNPNLDNQNPNNTNPNNQNSNPNPPPKTFTQEEVDLMLQKEGDRRVSSAKEKFEQEFKQKLETERSEAEKLARMNEEERMKLELDKQKQAFEEEKKQFLLERMELETTKELAKLNLPTSFAKWLLAEKSETVAQNIKDFKSEWETAIQKEVEAKLQGTTPKVSTKVEGVAVTKEQFKSMNYKQRMEIFEKDPNLYQQLSS